MKKILSILSAIIFVFSAVPLGCISERTKNTDLSFLSVKSSASNENNLFFDLNNDEISYYVSSCETSAVGSVVIPSTVNNMPVTAIGEDAFWFCNGLISIVIPDTITDIRNSAFYGCSSLVSVVIPKSVTHIGEYAFYNCDSLTDVYYTGSETDWNNIQFDVGNTTIMNTEIHYNYNCTPETVKLKNIENTSKGVKISWNSAENADQYIIYRKSGSADFKAIKTVSSTLLSYTDTTVKSGTKYTYSVCASNSIGKGTYNKTGLSIKFLGTPTVKISNKDGYISVSWNKITGASGYYVYRKAGSAKSWSRITTVKKNETVTYKDKNVKSGTNYIYTVKAYNGETTSSNTKTTTLKYLSKPTVKLSDGDGCIVLSWNKISGAAGYVVYRKAGSAKKWTKYSTVTDGSTVKVKDTNVKSGTNYSYTVKAYNGKYSGVYSSAGATIKYLSAVKLKPSVLTSNGGIKLTWGKVTGASGYYIYRKTEDGSYKKIATTKSASYVDNNVKVYVNYEYYVRAYNGKSIGYYVNTSKCRIYYTYG